MSSTRRLAILAWLAVVAGCASDSGLSPTKPPSPSVVAHHLDTLYESAVASNPTRAAVLTYAELAPAFGAVPSVITTTTVAHGDSTPGDSTLHQWSGFEIEVVSATDTTWYFVAYSDSSVTNAIVIERYLTYPGGGAVLLANGTTSVSTNLTYGAMGQTTVGSTCAPVTGLSNPTVANFGRATCQLATFNSLMVGEFTVPPNVDPGFAKIVIESTTWTTVPSASEVDVQILRLACDLAHDVRREPCWGHDGGRRVG